LITYDAQTIRRAIEAVRLANPFLVMTHSPSDYMVDHEMTSRLVRAACFAAPAPNAVTEARSAAPPLAGVPYLYYADPLEGKDIFGRPVVPGFYIDISDVIELKQKMLACHASQREWLLRQHGIDHYIDSMKEWSARRGAEIGVSYAEGFRQHLGHAYPQDNRLAELLGAAETD
jgi:LmbE family N-acetylglucosaminyl deacetylase